MRCMKEVNKNWFTLVELLAVIVIMGILMMVAIPAISRVIENSRKDTFVDIAKSYANSAKTLWTADTLTCEGTVASAVDDGDYYILINTVESASGLREYVNNDVYNALPADLRSGIIDVKVVSGYGSSDSANFTSTDKLYLFELKEVYGNNEGTAYRTTRQLDYYSSIGVISSNYSGAIKQRNGSNSYWWFRSPYSSGNNRFCYAYSDGDWYSNLASNKSGVSPAFRIA